MKNQGQYHSKKTQSIRNKSKQTHEERLKNCHKIYQQLHHSSVRTYIIQKKHLDTFQTSKREDPCSRGNARIHNIIPGIKPYGAKSPSVQQSRDFTKNNQKQGSSSKISTDIRERMRELETSQKKTDRDHLEVIKRLLQASSKVHFKEPQQTESIKGIFEQKLSEDLQSRYSRRRSRMETHENNSEVNKRSFSILESRQNRVSFEKCLSGDKVSVKNQVTQIPNMVVRKVKKTNASREKSSQKGRTNVSKSPSFSKDRKNQPREHLQNRKSFWLESYMRFINCPEDNRDFYIHLNFQSVRKMSSQEAWQSLDLPNAAVIEKIMHGIYESAEKYGQTSDQQIMDYCVLYFNNHEKIKMELILKEHYFKLFAFRLKPVFVYQRIVLYLIYFLAKSGTMNSLHFMRQKAMTTALTLKTVYSLIIEIITQTENGKKNSLKGINQTFRILKSVGEVERKIQFLEQEIQKIVQFVSETNTDKGTQKMHEIIEVHKNLFPFVNEDSIYGPRSYENFIKMEMLLSWRYLKAPPTPFLPAKKQEYLYTLVVDLDETLIYFNQEDNILKYRPALDTFFRIVKILKFEIVLFSASSKLYADTIVKEIQCKGPIFDFRLYKEHLTLYKGRMVKDIRRFGRDLARTIIIDDISTNFISCPENGIEVGSWTGDKKDSQLVQVLRFLKELIDESEQSSTFVDVRDQIKKNHQFFQEMLEEESHQTQGNTDGNENNFLSAR